MPDRYGFDHLGARVRCIDCPEGGPLWTWPEERRYDHAQTHRPTQPPVIAELRRQRELLAAPRTDTNEESKENTTMATSKTTKSESTKTVTLELLAKADEPLPAKEIAKRVIESGRCTSLKGKTPEATISAMLAVGSEPGGPFKRVGKGTYTLADPLPTRTEESEPEAAAEKRGAVNRSPRKGQATASTSEVGR